MKIRLFGLLMIIALAGAAQDREYNRDRLDELRDRDDFDYPIESATENQDRSLLTRFFEGIANFMQALFNSGIGYILLAAIVILIIYAIVKNSKGSVKSARDQLPQGEDIIVTSEEELESLDLKSLLANALKSTNYRLAIRFSYLLLLQELNRSQRIVWRAEKTNYDYLKELNGDLSFRRLLYIYEYIWYGEFEANEKLFREVEERKRKLNQASS